MTDRNQRLPLKFVKDGLYQTHNGRFTAELKLSPGPDDPSNAHYPLWRLTDATGQYPPRHAAMATCQHWVCEALDIPAPPRNSTTWVRVRYPVDPSSSDRDR